MDETETGNSGYWKSRMKVSMQIGTGLIISGIMILLAATAILRIQVYNVRYFFQVQDNLTTANI
jgi:hypothetical protein